MKFIFNKETSYDIEPGDVVISEQTICLVVKSRFNENFKILLINLTEGKEENAFTNLDTLNKKRYVKENDPIIRIIKNRDLILKEVETTSFAPEITEDNVAIAEEVERKINEATNIPINRRIINGKIEVDKFHQESIYPDVDIKPLEKLEVKVTVQDDPVEEPVTKTLPDAEAVEYITEDYKPEPVRRHTYPDKAFYSLDDDNRKKKKCKGTTF